MIKNIDKGIRSLNVLLAYAGSYVLFGMMLLTIFDVIGRYIFNLPITGAYEITEAMMVTVVFFFIGYAQAKKKSCSRRPGRKSIASKIKSAN